MYSKIVNPKTGRKVSVTSRLGKSIVRNYLNVLTGGSRRVHQVPPRALGPVAPTSVPPAPYNGGNIPWYYMAERQLLRDGWSMTTLGAGVRVSGTPAYYFKMHPNTYWSNSTTDIYWGPLYYHSDGSYRSNNSREAAMMTQQYMAMNFPGASWNQEAATLPTAPAIPTEYPRELQHQLILIKPLQALQAGAAIAPHNNVSSSALPQRGEVLGFKWPNPDGTGAHSSLGSFSRGIVYPITKDQWINEQLNLPNTDRHYSLAPRQQELANQKLRIKRGFTGRREATRMVEHVKDLPVSDDALGQVLGYLSSSAVADSTKRQYIQRRTLRDAALRAAAAAEEESAGGTPDGGGAAP